MSVGEIRGAVLRTSDWKEQADAWRNERVDLLLRGKGPCRMYGDGALVVHVVPMMARELDLGDQALHNLLRDTGLPDSGGWSPRITYDGYLVAGSPSTIDATDSWYRLWMNSGRVECVVSNLVYTPANQDHGLIDGARLDTLVEGAIRQTFEPTHPDLLRPPCLVMATLVDVKGAKLAAGENIFAFMGPPLDRNEYFLPPLFVEEAPEDWWPTLAPLINRLWQAVGKARSPFLNNDGTRR